MRRLITCSLLALASTITLAEVDPFGEDSCDAPDKPAQAPRNIRVQMVFIEVSQSQARQLLKQPTSLYSRVQEQLKEGKASLLNHTVLIARSGERSRVGSVRELIYPTEVEAHSLPPVKNGLAGNIPELPKLRPTASCPTAFETHHVGESLLIEPTISEDGGHIELWLLHELVSHRRDSVMVTHKDRWGRADVRMPEFDTMTTNTSINLADGKMQFVSIHTPQLDTGDLDTSRKILVFVKASIVSPK
ncbi:hypothetical protein NT6N_28800 [Oceaniferula spumae]|uniref:Uncharacterized protein n=1 Tax=Oceaniferula spumae TaxID=2979115 RepID=A0AAT9FP90_9BACT